MGIEDHNRTFNNNKVQLEMSAYGVVHWNCRRIVENLASQKQEEGTIPENTSFSGRGGSTINAIGDEKVIMFGGANREMVHFSDVWVFDSPLKKETDSTDVARYVRLMIIAYLYR